ncbi:MAG: NAD(P)H-hydrate epimerase, partial [Acidimicrobiia bacterium]
MRPVLTVAEMRRVDSLSPTPVPDMMQRAGYAVALEVAEMGGTYGSTIDVLAGKGNNGGDGYVAAAFLRRRGAA